MDQATCRPGGLSRMENGITVRLQAKCCMIPPQTIDGVSYTFQSSGAWLQQETAPAVSITKEQAEQWFYATYAIIANETGWNQEYFVSTPEKYAGDARTRLEMAWG